MRKKCRNNSKMSLNSTHPPLRDDNKLATISEGCSVIQANQRPPGGSITVHRGILTPPRDEKKFMGMWMCVTEWKCVCAIGTVVACNGVRGRNAGQYVGDYVF